MQTQDNSTNSSSDSDKFDQILTALSRELESQINYLKKLEASRQRMRKQTQEYYTKGNEPDSGLSPSLSGSV